MSDYASAAPAATDPDADIWARFVGRLEDDPGALHLKRIDDLMAALVDEIGEFLETHEDVDCHDSHCNLCHYLAESNEGYPTVRESLATARGVLHMVGSSVNRERPHTRDDGDKGEGADGAEADGEGESGRRVGIAPADPAAIDPAMLAEAKASVRAVNAAAPAGVAAGLAAVLDERFAGWSWAFLNVNGADREHAFSVSLPSALEAADDPAPDTVVDA